jgi:hypothetical protein
MDAGIDSEAVLYVREGAVLVGDGSGLLVAVTGM